MVPTVDRNMQILSRFLGHTSEIFGRDDPPQPDDHLKLHALPVKPFNHLTIWAYFAFAFILLAVTTVLAYLVYSCYHSARANQRHIEHRSSRRFAGGTVGVDLAGISPKRGGMGLDKTRINDNFKLKAEDAGEKVKSAGYKSAPTVAKIKTLGLSFGHKKYQSESQHNMISLSHPNNASQNSLFSVNEGSFDPDSHYRSSLPLAHTPDGVAIYIPFHLPPPPPSPTAAHKQYLERQRQYRGSGQYSPVSPSPSFCPNLSPPPITAKRSRPRPPEHGGVTQQIATNANGQQRDNKRAVEFDSNNIRFAPPLDPFMDPFAAQLWNEPKLSPIHSSIITNSGSPTTSDTAFCVNTPSVTPKKGVAAHIAYSLLH